MQLLGRQWLLQANENSRQKKFFITSKGQAFLEKWLELQKLTEIKGKQKLATVIPPPKIHATSKGHAN
jgi:DNA-binding PadR family transcriptional regulator